MKRPWLIGLLLFAIFAGWLGKTSMDKSAWKKKIKELLAAMYAGGELNGLKPEILAALAAHETGFGQGRIFQGSNNLFSITAGKTWNGPTITSGAKDPSGAPYKFRVYPTWRESVLDVVALLGWTRYAAARKAAVAGDPAAFGAALMAAGYVAGDPGYTAKIVSNFNAIRTA